MPDRLLLRLASDGRLTWLCQSASARMPAASEAGEPPASVLADSGEIVVLVPAEDVLLTEVKLGARNRAQLLQALPFAVEEQLLGAIEEQHFAAATGSGDTFGAAVVAKEKMRGWLARLADAGIQPDVLMPESLALSVPTSGTSAIVEDTRAVVRLSAWSAFACSLRELPSWLEQVNAEGAIAPLTVHDFRAAPALALPVPVAAYRERQRDALSLLASGFTQAPLNLLDGEFATAHRHARGARWWRVAAMLAAAVIVLAIANLGFDVWRLSRDSARMDTLAQDALRTAFPDIDTAQLARLSPADLMRGRLERLRGGAESTGLLKVLAQISPILGGTTRIQTRGMEYRNGVFELALRAPDVAMLDSVRERLMTVPGVQAVVTAANPTAEGVDGRIRISNPADTHGGTP
jgi:general secretion pathway protein L